MTTSEVDNDVRHFAAGDLQDDGLGQFLGYIHRHDCLLGFAQDLGLVRHVGLAGFLLANDFRRLSLLSGLLIKSRLFYCLLLALNGCQSVLLGLLLGFDLLALCLLGAALRLGSL
jgi:hypothetical protein